MNCCGASGPDDYRHSAWFNRSRPVEEVFVPASCCVGGVPPSNNEDRRRDALLRPSEPRDQDSCQLNAILFPNHDKSSRSLRTQVSDTAHTIRLGLEEASSHKSAKTNAGTVLLCLVALTFHLFTQNKWAFQDSSWSISVSSLMIIAAAVFWDFVRIKRQTDRQTDRQTPAFTLSPRMPSAWVNILPALKADE